MSTQSIPRMRSSWKTLSTLSVLAAAALLLLAPKALAQSVWTGAGTDDNWETAANWGGTAPTAGTTTALQFAGSTQTTANNNFAGNTIFGNITFNSGASTFTLTGNTVEFDSTANGAIITNSSSNNQIIDLGITLVGGKDMAVAANGYTITFNGNISFGNSRLYNDVGTSGTLVFNGNNTGTGYNQAFYQTGVDVMESTIYNSISGMTYVVGNANALGNSSATGLEMNQNTYLQSNTDMSGSNSLVTSIAIGGGVTLTINGSSNLTVAGNLFNSNNSTSGNTLAVTNTAATVFSGSVFLSSGGTARTMTFNVSTTLVLSGAVQNADSADSTTTGAEVGSLSKSGSGTLSLSGTNTYTGTTTISAGTLAITGSGTLGSGSYAGAISNTGNFTYSSSSAQTLSGVISGAGNVTQSGTGTLTLSAANTYTGTTAISAGSTLALTGNGSIASTSAYIIGVSGSTNGYINDSASQLATSGKALTLNFTSTLSPNSFTLYTASSLSGDFSSVTATGLLSGSLALSSGTWSGTLGGYNLSLIESTGVLTVSAIPEPATYTALVGLGALGFVLWRRRRAS